MEKRQLTPSQTVGPFFAYSLTAHQYDYDFNSIVNNSLLGKLTEGPFIFIEGTVFDGDGSPITDAVVEFWQCDRHGQYRSEPIEVHPHEFTGFGRLGTGAAAFPHFRFLSVKPGAINNQTPHINVMLSMRGSLHILYTRIYFSDEQNDRDPLLLMVPEERRKTLIAKRNEKDGVVTYHFDIHMQGERETVFFDINS